jgi:hypothetical protein
MQEFGTTLPWKAHNGTTGLTLFKKDVSVGNITESDTFGNDRMNLILLELIKEFLQVSLFKNGIGKRWNGALKYYVSQSDKEIRYVP